MSQWISFRDRLPTSDDADENGQVELAETNGSRRRGLWNWIPPSHLDARQLWHCNGFAAWRRLRCSSTRSKT